MAKQPISRLFYCWKVVESYSRILHVGQRGADSRLPSTGLLGLHLLVPELLRSPRPRQTLQTGRTPVYEAGVSSLIDGSRNSTKLQTPVTTLFMPLCSHRPRSCSSSITEHSLASVSRSQTPSNAAGSLKGVHGRRAQAPPCRQHSEHLLHSTISLTGNLFFLHHRSFGRIWRQK